MLTKDIPLEVGDILLMMTLTTICMARNGNEVAHHPGYDSKAAGLPAASLFLLAEAVE